jgi:hypothetical protein
MLAVTSDRRARMAKKKRKPRYTAYPGEEKTVVCVLIDTCVWIDFATEPRDQQLMWVLEGLGA